VTLQSRPLGIDTLRRGYPALTFLGTKRKKAKAQQIWSNQQIRSIILENSVVPPAHAQQCLPKYPQIMQYPTIVGFPDFSRFYRGGSFQRQIPSLFSTCFVVCMLILYPYSARVFLCGIAGRRVVEYFLPENPTFFVRRNRKIPHHKHSLARGLEEHSTK